MRWFLVTGFEQAGCFGVDARDEFLAMGHEVRIFAYPASSSKIASATHGYVRT